MRVSVSVPPWLLDFVASAEMGVSRGTGKSGRPASATQHRERERERERREGEGENERSVMDSSKPENELERFSDSAFADSLRAWPHVSPA